MNFVQTDLNKVSKYTLRLRKSILNNEQNKTKEYYDHLKYHIQLGGLEEEQLKSKFEQLDKLIETLSDKSKGYKTFKTINNELSQCNQDKGDLEAKNKELQNQFMELQKELESSTKGVAQINEIVDKKEIKDKDDKIKSLNNEIDELNNKIPDLEKQVEKLKEENSNFDNELNTLKQIVDKIFGKSKLTDEQIKSKSEELMEKISRYEEILKKLKSEAENIDSTEKERFNQAIQEIEYRLKNSNELKENLEKITEENKKLQDELDKVKKTSDELNKTQSELKSLERTIKDKDDKINELNDEIRELQTEKETKDKKIDEFSRTFDEKLKKLLNTIYGTPELVDNIFNGTKLDDTVN